MGQAAPAHQQPQALRPQHPHDEHDVHEHHVLPQQQHAQLRGRERRGRLRVAAVAREQPPAPRHPPELPAVPGVGDPGPRLRGLRHHHDPAADLRPPGDHLHGPALVADPLLLDHGHPRLFPHGLHVSAGPRRAEARQGGQALHPLALLLRPCPGQLRLGRGHARSTGGRSEQRGCGRAAPAEHAEGDPSGEAAPTDQVAEALRVHL
mmetsp:Transcript_173437/g.421866  ORF Transcript_173437/g.421866 Transcript_173437/m.421866 type:complete len:207 (-) Transcript_173437:199-819(-)